MVAGGLSGALGLMLMDRMDFGFFDGCGYTKNGGKRSDILARFPTTYAILPMIANIASVRLQCPNLSVRHPSITPLKPVS